jgi:hypothetical protein
LRGTAWRLAGCLAALWFLGEAALPGGEYDSRSEYRLKAAVLLKLIPFVEWPPDAFADKHDAIVVGILGSDPFGTVLDETFRNQTVQGRRFVLKRLGPGGTAQGCHLLFISRSEQASLPSALNGLGSAALLTVSDLDRFAEQGGMIRMFLQEEMVRFEINLALAEQHQMKISSKLLKFAKVVNPVPGANGATP